MFATLALLQSAFPAWHNILINFTAGLLPVSLLFDLLGVTLRKPELHVAAWWTLLVAAAVAPFTALAGWLWYLDIRPVDYWQMPYHQVLGTLFPLALIALALWRGRMHRVRRTPGAAYAGVGTLFFLALATQGELGGSMVHDRGVLVGDIIAPADDDDENDEEGTE